MNTISPEDQQHETLNNEFDYYFTVEINAVLSPVSWDGAVEYTDCISAEGVRPPH